MYHRKFGTNQDEPLLRVNEKNVYVNQDEILLKVDGRQVS